MKTFATEIIRFYRSLEPPKNLPGKIDYLFPQQNKVVLNSIEEFYKKYYNDTRTRSLVFGINPGRFGAGTTGINFTAPRQLKEACGIDHSFKNQSELSAEFIYEMIKAYGGCEKFYTDFFISAVSPLGFIKEGKNLNYYDDRNLLQDIRPFIIDCIHTQTQWNVNLEKCFCIGGEKNFRFLASLNEKHSWFKKIIPLPHPRFIMQYRRKLKQKFIEQYLQAFNP